MSIARLVKGLELRAPHEIDALGALLDELKRDEGTGLERCKELDAAARDGARAVVGAEQRVPRWVRDMGVLRGLDLTGELTVESPETLSHWVSPWAPGAARFLRVRVGLTWPELLPEMIVGVERLHISGDVPDLSGVTGLLLPATLTLDLPAVTELGAIADHPEVRHLTLLNARDVRDFRPLAEMSQLTLRGVDIVDLRPLVAARGLRTLSVTSPALVSTLGLGALPALEVLSLIGCPELRSLPELVDHPRLNDLRIDECPGLSTLSALPPRLESLSLSGLPIPSLDEALREPPERVTLGDLPALSRLTLGEGVQSLAVYRCPLLCAITLPPVRTLSLHDMPALTHLSGASIAAHGSLSVAGTALSSLPPLAMPLSELELENNPQLVELGSVPTAPAPVAGLQLAWSGWAAGTPPPLVNAFSYARFSGWPEVPLERYAGGCNTLIVDGCATVTGWNHLTQLVHLWVGYSPFSAPTGALKLIRLTLHSIVGPVDVSPLANHPALQELLIVNAPTLSDLGALATIPTLRYVHLSGCPRVTDLTPLLALPPGGTLDVRGTGIKKVPRGLKWRVIGLGG